MNLTSLTAISPVDGRYHSKTTDLQPIFSEYGLIYHRLVVEIRWLQSLASNKTIDGIKPLNTQASAALDNMLTQFSATDAQQIKDIEQTTNHDVKAVEYFLKKQLEQQAALAPASEFIHFACTSEDINNLAYALMLKTATQQCILPQLNDLIAILKDFAHRYADCAMLARTHGQAAVPTTLGKEFANFADRLQRQYKQIADIQLTGKMNGAIGNFNAHYCAYPDVDWLTHCQHFVEQLGLQWNAYTTQIEPHDSIATLCHAIIRSNTILVDYARDIWGYISLGYFTQRLVDAEVGSSTMPHKINPIDFEQAEGNLLLANALLQHMASELPTSRWQRDLTDSTLLRNLGVAFAHTSIALQALHKGSKKLTAQPATMQQELASHWEILAEAVQTVMRRHGVKQAYEKLKTLTRGQKLDQATLHTLIAKLEIPESAKQQLKRLQPGNYLGLAATLARDI